MPLPSVPSESKTRINRAGQILVSDGTGAAGYDRARDLANRWRACHAYPINTFQATLRAKVRGFSDPIVAQRLKRMSTIIDKLRRYPAMQLTTMQDIAGVRAVLGSVVDVYRLAEEYKTNSRFAHELVDEKDYIQNPRSEDGYRSIHLIYKYKNSRNPQYNDLRVEVQIRTRLQHTWATAVETMGTLLGQALKSRQGDQEWLDFFAVTSSAFAYIERTPAIPRYSHLSRQDTSQAVARAEREIDALDKMRAFSVAAEHIAKRSKASSYHLIVLDSLERRVTVTAYDRGGFERAMADYSGYERQAAEGMKIEPVLVSAGPIDKLRRAYPNFFLDIGDFVRWVARIVRSGT